MNTGDMELKRRAFVLFKEVVELDVDSREARLAEACAGSADLRTQVDALLAADARNEEPFAGDAASWSAVLQDDPQTLTEDALIGRSLGAWRITGVLGHGGMGAVYRVERDDGAYAQHAALKLIRSSADSAAARERFLRERQTLARLQHPHIATLLDGGISGEGDPYFVMEYVDGVAIDTWCDSKRLDLRQRVILFLQVLEAVQYAHRNLVVHRDLKPANILVTPDGRVKLLDFGIARQLQDSRLTAASDRALTLEYAAPEQLSDEPVTTATDLYQLGVVLCGLLCGAHPFGVDSHTPVARQLQALSRDPQPMARTAQQSPVESAALRGHTPASLARAVRGNLSAMVHACLRREPETRYASAEVLANDLRAWLDDRPVVAARLGRAERLRLWLRRNRVLAVSGAAVAIALMAGTGVALWQAHEAREQARIAERESANARAALAFLADTLGAAAPEQALSREVSVRELLDKARAQLDQRTAIDLQVRQPVQRMLGHLYASLGEPSIANDLFAQGLAGIEPATREEALALASDLSAQVDTLASLERGKEALAAARRAVVLREQFAPGDALQHMRAANDLATGYYAANDYDRATSHWRRAIREATSLPDASVDEVIGIHHSLANLLREQGDTDGALELTAEGLALADRAQVPAKSPLRVPLLRIRTDAQIANGEIAEAEKTVREAIALQSAVIGGGGGQMGALYNSLGLVLFEQGRFRDAASAFSRGSDLLAAVGEPPEKTAAMITNVAGAWESAGDYTRARQLYDRAIGLLDQAGAPADNQTRRGLLRNYARVLFFSGHAGEARVLLDRLMQQARVLDGEDSLEMAWVVWQQLMLARRERDAVRGTQLLEDARRRWAALVPPEHAVFAHALVTGAVFAESKGDFAAAERDLREAVRRFEAAGNKPVDLATTRATLARLELAQGDRAEARRLLDQALPVLREGVLPTHVGRAEAEALARRLGV